MDGVAEWRSDCTCCLTAEDEAEFVSHVCEVLDRDMVSSVAAAIYRLNREDVHS